MARWTYKPVPPLEELRRLITEHQGRIKVIARAISLNKNRLNGALRRHGLVEEAERARVAAKVGGIRPLTGQSGDRWAFARAEARALLAWWQWTAFLAAVLRERRLLLKVLYATSRNCGAKRDIHGQRIRPLQPKSPVLDLMRQGVRWDRAAAAAMLCMSVWTLERRIKEYGLRPARWPEARIRELSSRVHSRGVHGDRE